MEKDQLKVEKYWSLDPQIDKDQTNIGYIDEIQKKFNHSIYFQSRSDVPVGTFLSGGVDSSAITAELCLRTQKSINTFTMDFEGKNFNEGNYAQLVAHKYNTEHHFQTLSLDYALENLQELIPLIDEPMADSSMIPSYILSKLAKDQNIKVILVGAGGDELFGGYQRHYPSLRDKLSGCLPYIPLHFWNLIGRMATPKLAHYGGLTWDKGVSFAQSTSGVNLGFFERLLKNPKDFSKSMILTRNHFSSMSHYEKNLGFSYARMLVDVQNYLVDNVLALTDKTSMAASVEARVPLLDHRLVKLAFSVPENINIGRDFHDSKVSFKKAVKSNLPYEILKRPKAGFNGPVYEWINKKHPKFEDRILKPRNPYIQSMFDHDSIKKTWLKDSNRLAACETFFMIYIADMWLENHA